MDEGLIKIYLSRACYIVATYSGETTSRRFVFAGNSFSDCYSYKVRKVNNNIIMGHPMILILDNGW